MRLTLGEAMELRGEVAVDEFIHRAIRSLAEVSATADILLDLAGPILGLFPCRKGRGYFFAAPPNLDSPRDGAVLRLSLLELRQLDVDLFGGQIIRSRLRWHSPVTPALERTPPPFSHGPSATDARATFWMRCKSLIINMVPGEGLEPSRGFPRAILRRAWINWSQLFPTLNRKNRKGLRARLLLPVVAKSGLLLPLDAPKNAPRWGRRSRGAHCVPVVEYRLPPPPGHPCSHGGANPCGSSIRRPGRLNGSGDSAVRPEVLVCCSELLASASLATPIEDANNCFDERPQRGGSEVTHGPLNDRPARRKQLPRPREAVAAKPS